MTRPNPSDETLTHRTQEANASLSEKLESGEIERGFEDEDSEDTEEEKIEQLREFRERNSDWYDSLGETEMVVTEDGETTTYTRDEWQNERGTRARTWERLERGGDNEMFVKVARWFNDEDVNAVKVGQTFMGEKTGETDDAYQFTVEPNSENATASTRTFWVPKKAVRTHQLQ